MSIYARSNGHEFRWNLDGKTVRGKPFKCRKYSRYVFFRGHGLREEAQSTSSWYRVRKSHVRKRGPFDFKRLLAGPIDRPSSGSRWLIFVGNPEMAPVWCSSRTKSLKVDGDEGKKSIASTWYDFSTFQLVIRCFIRFYFFACNIVLSFPSCQFVFPLNSVFFVHNVFEYLKRLTHPQSRFRWD